MSTQFFHGSPVRGLTEILPRSATGAVASDGRRAELFPDVVFLTTSIDIARGYAGPRGVVYLVSAPEARNFRAAVAAGEGAMKGSVRRQKIVSLRPEIFIAPRAEVVGLVGPIAGA